MRIRMDGPAKVTLVGDEVLIEGTSGGQVIQWSYKRTDCDRMFAEYFDMLVGDGSVPAILASFMGKS